MLEFQADTSIDTFRLSAEFSAPAGVTALFGRSGAGKSTIVRIAAGLVKPNRGRIVLNGRTLFDSDKAIHLPPCKRGVGMVFQEALLFPHLSVRRNLLYGHWAARRRPTHSLDEIVTLLELGGLLARRPSTLSGGEAQRVAIGRALMADPQILMMDEPLAHLDSAKRSEILPFLDRLAHEGGIPILYVSHQVDEVARLANRVVIISEGCTVAEGDITDLFNRPELSPILGPDEAGAIVEARVMTLLGDYSLAELSVGAGRFLVSAGRAKVGDSVRVRIRASDVALALEAPETISIRNIVHGVITKITGTNPTNGTPDWGAHAEVVVDIGGQFILAQITRHAVAELNLEAGKDVYCLVKSMAIQRP